MKPESQGSKIDALSRFSLWSTVLLLTCSIDPKYMGDIFRLGKVRAVIALACVPMFLYVKKNIHWSVGALLCFGVFYWIANDFHIYSVMHLVGMTSCIFVSIFLYRFPKEAVAKAFVWIAAAQATYGILQIFNIQLLYDVPEPWFWNTPLALMGQHTVLGGFLAACLAPALWFSMWVPALLITVCTLFTGSSMAYASLWVVLTLFTAHKFGIKHAVGMQLKLLVFIAGVLVFWHSPELTNPHERLILWGKAMEAWSLNPILGGGPGFWSGDWQPNNFPIIGTNRPDNLHAEWATLLVEYGIAGLCIVTCGIIDFFSKFRLTWHHAICCAILVNALANFPFHIVPHSVLFLWCFGLSMERYGKS